MKTRSLLLCLSLGMLAGPQGSGAPPTSVDSKSGNVAADLSWQEDDFKWIKKEVQPIMLRLMAARPEGLDPQELVKCGQGALAYWQQGKKPIACERFDKLMELLVSHSDKSVAEDGKSKPVP